MEIAQALKIIRILADGIDPATGEVFENDSPYQNPTVIRALFTAISAMERQEGRDQRSRRLPANAGKPWSSDEDNELISSFKRGMKAGELSQRHERTIGSIESRLVKHGLIEQKTT